MGASLFLHLLAPWIPPVASKGLGYKGGVWSLDAGVVYIGFLAMT